VSDWLRLSPYAITNGRHHIAKLLVHNEPGYLLWLDGRFVHFNFTTAAQAKTWALEHEGPPPATLTEEPAAL
jgi:hypothetical protein